MYVVEVRNHKSFVGRFKISFFLWYESILKYFYWMNIKGESKRKNTRNEKLKHGLVYLFIKREWKSENSLWHLISILTWTIQIICYAYICVYFIWLCCVKVFIVKIINFITITITTVINFERKLSFLYSLYLWLCAWCN